MIFEDGEGSAKEDEVFFQVPSMSAWLQTGLLAAAAAGTLVVSGCAEAPYVTSDYRYHQRGIVQICLDEGTAKIGDTKKLAEEICRQYDRTSNETLVQRYQCSWTAPTLVTYTCVARPGETPPPFTEHLSPMRHDTTLGPQ